MSDNHTNGLVPPVAYYRALTDKQDTSVADQQKAVQQYAAERGYHILREYADDGISGDEAEKCVDFLRMLGDAQQRGDFKAILCWGSR
jgi:site-specific DNA recombinase